MPRTKAESPLFELSRAQLRGLTSNVSARYSARGKMVTTPRVRYVTLDTGEQFFKCPVCNVASKNGSSITPHLKRHTAEERDRAVRRLTSLEARQAKSQLAPVVQLRTPVVEPTINTPRIMSDLEAFIAERDAERDELLARISELEGALATVTTVAASVTR